MTLDNEINAKHGNAADRNFKETEIAWDKKINGLTWFNDKPYKAKLEVIRKIVFIVPPKSTCWTSVVRPMCFMKPWRWVHTIERDLRVRGEKDLAQKREPEKRFLF